MPFPVLLVSGGGFQGLAVLKALRRSSAPRVLIADCHAENVTRHLADGFFQVPLVAERESFLGALLAICERERVRLVLPCTDYEQAALAGARGRFGAVGAEVAVSAPEFVASSADKRGLLRLLAGAGMPVLEELEPRREGHYPRIGKPLVGWGSRGLRIVRSPEEWQRQDCPALALDFLWQPYLEGCREYSVDFALAADGSASGLGLRERLRVSGGIAVVSEAAADEAATELAQRAVAAIRAHGARGLFNLQFLSHGGRLYASDLNRRLGTSGVHWCGVGPHPALFLCRSLDPSVQDGEPLRPRRMVRVLDELWLEPQPRPAGIRGVVLDLDDTLIHQKLWIAGKLERLIAELGDGPLDPRMLRAEALRLIEEGPRDRLLDVLAERCGLAAARVPELIERYRALLPQEDVVFPEVREVLARLREAGLRIALLADNPPASQRQKLAQSGLAGSFDAVVLTQEAGAEKPAAPGFARVAAALGEPASALAMVGDNPYRDGLGALRAGYAAAYWVRRRGTLFNFEPRLVARLELGRLREIRDLRGLLADLAR